MNCLLDVTVAHIGRCVMSPWQVRSEGERTRDKGRELTGTEMSRGNPSKKKKKG